MVAVSESQISDLQSYSESGESADQVIEVASEGEDEGSLAAAKLGVPLPWSVNQPKTSCALDQNNCQNNGLLPFPSFPIISFLATWRLD